MHLGMVVAVATAAMTTLLPGVQPSAPVQSWDSAAPISVTSCALSTSKVGSIAWITFVNKSQVAAVNLHFTVKPSNGPSFELSDVGTFSPDVVVKHAFRPPLGSYQLGGQATSCRVSYAGFLNGTVWRPA